MPLCLAPAMSGGVPGMVKFPSEEWIFEFQKAVNASKAYAEAAKDWEGDFLFTVEPEGAFTDTTHFYVDLWHGQCRKVGRVADPATVKTEFVWAGRFGAWEKVIRGELDPIKGLLMGKFRLKGNMAKVMRYTRAAQELTACIAKVPTEFA